MFVPKLRRRQRSWSLFRRLDHAAAALNPILTLITIGLVLIDLIGLCSLLNRRYTIATFWTCSSQVASPRTSGQGNGL